jgi:enoyl-CoA hydratase/carnithine racemase
MDYEQILYEVKGRVAVITLNRPEVLNAWTPQMGQEIIDALEKSNNNDKAGAVVITGAGRGFCSGADMRLFGQMADELQKASDPEALMQKSREQLTGVIDLLIRKSLNSKPIIGAINGPAVGIGATMTLAWDVRLASEKASFGFVFTRLGLVPEAGSSFLLPRIIGISKALELIYSGRIIDAKEASEIGLVDHVLPPEKLMPTALEIAEDYAKRPSMALRLAKELIIKGAFFHGLEEALSLEREYFIRCQLSPEHREIIRAFLEKGKTSSAHA